MVSLRSKSINPVSGVINLPITGRSPFCNSHSSWSSGKCREKIRKVNLLLEIYPLLTMILGRRVPKPGFTYRFFVNRILDKGPRIEGFGIFHAVGRCF